MHCSNAQRVVVILFIVYDFVAGDSGAYCKMLLQASQVLLCRIVRQTDQIELSRQYGECKLWRIRAYIVHVYGHDIPIIYEKNTGMTITHQFHAQATAPLILVLCNAQVVFAELRIGN